MKKYILSFIPQKIKNHTVIHFLEILRKLQQVFHKDYTEQWKTNDICFQKHEKQIKKDKGYIEDQKNFQDMKFGKVTMQYAGCEIIAAFNALQSLKKEQNISLPDMIAQFEKDGMLLAGRFGTAPGAIRDYFKKKGYKVFFSTNEIEFEEIAKNSTTLILTFYNDSRNIRKQIHTINISKNTEGFVGHNVHGNGVILGPYETIGELIAQINGGKAKAISMIGIL